MIFQPGCKVRLISTGEVGVVIHSWMNQEMNVVDYHVAFYGNEFPHDVPDAPPYVLRYFGTSLERVAE